MSADMTKIRAEIIGGAGYAGGELIRLLLRHPHVETAAVQSASSAGKPIYSVHKDLIGETEIVFSDKASGDCDVLFLCMGHGQANEWLQNNCINPKTKIIDLSQDFRYTENTNFIYGLPELRRDAIRTEKKHIANPGCFATAVQLALLPLASAHVLSSDIHATAITGSTGAGQNLSPTSHFSWRSQNVQIYKPFDHQHLREIRISLQLASASNVPPLHFIPIRGNFTRGIHASLVTKTSLDHRETVELFSEYYRTHYFVTVLPEGLPELKMVTQTNKCVVGFEVKNDMILIVSVIDNLLKGAAGQAVQNMNLLFDFPETCGLMLKSSGF